MNLFEVDTVVTTPADVTYIGAPTVTATRVENSNTPASFRVA
jgi:hypothetical protein